jgi:5-methyltetrahydropteroyltriglutamate--homocysteine methyltransferase
LSSNLRQRMILPAATDLVAERLVRYANLVGRENVLAGTDCGLGTRVGHPSIFWAKFGAMVEGARRATKILWGHG